VFGAVKRSRHLIGNALRVAISLLALAILFRQVGGGAVFQELRRANWTLLSLAWALFLVGVVVRAVRWRALLQGLGLRPPFLLLLKLYFIGGFFNAFLPSGFGGDVIRVLELGREGDSPAALGTVLVDRMTGILSLLALGLVVLPFAHGLVPWVRGLFLLIAVGGLIAGGLVLQGTVLRRLTGYLPEKLSLTGDGPLARIYAAVTGSGARAIWMALAYSTLFNVLNIAIHWICALAVGIDLNLAFYFVLVPLLSLTLLVPISVGGLGARDWVAQMLLAPTAVPDARIAAWTLSVWVVTAAAGLVGGLLYLWQGIAGLTSRIGDRGQVTGDREQVTGDRE
jgi:glycosyltransferase 2 family protein